MLSTFDLQGSQAFSERVFAPGLVSIIIPTFNRERLLQATLSSIAEQSYRPLEVIISDDGSTDKTADVVSKWRESVIATNIEVKYVCYPNAGAPTARNRGMDEMRGEFIQFLDSDCLLDPDKILKQVKLLNSNPDFNFAYCHTRFVTPDGTCLYEVGSPLHSDPILNVVDILFSCIAPLWRYTAIQNIRWVDELYCLQDWIFKGFVLLRHPIGGYDNRCFCRAIIHDANRISKHDSYEFIQGKFQAVNLMEKLISRYQLGQNVRKAISLRYLSVFKAALKSSYHELAEEALSCAQTSGSNVKKIQLCYWINRMIGLHNFKLLLKKTGYI